MNPTDKPETASVVTCPVCGWNVYTPRPCRQCEVNALYAKCAPKFSAVPVATKQKRAEEDEE